MKDPGSRVRGSEEEESPGGPGFRIRKCLDPCPRYCGGMVHVRDPDHPVLPEAWKYEVVEFRWSCTGEEPRVGLALRHADTGELRRLRFVGTVDVKSALALTLGGLRVPVLTG